MIWLTCRILIFSQKFLSGQILSWTSAKQMQSAYHKHLIYEYLKVQVSHNKYSNNNYYFFKSVH